MTDHEAWVARGLFTAIEDLGGEVDLTANHIVFQGPNNYDLLELAGDLLVAIRLVARDHGYQWIDSLATAILPVWGEFNDCMYGLTAPRGRPRRDH